MNRRSLPTSRPTNRAAYSAERKSPRVASTMQDAQGSRPGPVPGNVPGKCANSASVSAAAPESRHTKKTRVTHRRSRGGALSKRGVEPASVTSTKQAAQIGGLTCLTTSGFVAACVPALTLWKHPEWPQSRRDLPPTPSDNHGRKPLTSLVWVPSSADITLHSKTTST